MKLSELKTVDSVYFHFYSYFYFHFHFISILNLGLEISMISHITVMHQSHVTVTHHIEHHRRFQNNNNILHTHVSLG